MYRALGAFVVGVVLAGTAFFFRHQIVDFIRYGAHHHEGHHVGSDVVVALAQPFGLTDAGNTLNADDVWDDSPDAVCEGALEIENRSHHPLSVALDVRRRDGGTLTLMDGPDTVTVPPGGAGYRVLRDHRISGDVSEADCNALNVPGALVVAVQACYGEGGDCAEAEIDPAGDAPRHEPQAGRAADRS